MISLWFHHRQDCKIKIFRRLSIKKWLGKACYKVENLHFTTGRYGAAINFGDYGDDCWDYIDPGYTLYTDVFISRLTFSLFQLNLWTVKTYNLHTKVYPILNTSHKYNMFTTSSVEDITMNVYFASFVFIFILEGTSSSCYVYPLLIIFWIEELYVSHKNPP